jgi:hypothetical protein
MKKIVALAALAFVLAAMPSVRAYACPYQNCATPEEATTPALVPAPTPAPTQVAGPCPTANCATPEPAPTQVATTPQSDHPARAAASLSPAGAA